MPIDAPITALTGQLSQFPSTPQLMPVDMRFSRRAPKLISERSQRGAKEAAMI